MNKKLLPLEIAPMLAPMLEATRSCMPPATCGVAGYFMEEVEMRDGVKLMTKVVVPDQGEKWPTLYTRTPYSAMWDLEPAQMVPFVEQGYAVVVQSCRGNNGSGGKYEPFMNERNDGIDAIRWLAKQPWHDGIATYGSSYNCFTQWVCADQMPPEVKTMYLDVFGIDRYAQIYMNGMFRHDIYTSWAVSAFAVHVDNTDQNAYKRAIMVRPHNKMDEVIAGQKMPFYQDYISKITRSDPYWKDGFWQTLVEIPAKVNVPVCIVEGWVDHNVEGVMTGIKGLRPEIRRQSQIILGPWNHFSRLSVDDIEYPGNKFGPGQAQLKLAWFDRMLKGKGADKAPVSEFYTIGTGEWNTMETWPPKTEQTALYLGSGGKLTSTPTEAGSESYEYDPANPVKTIGGNQLMTWMGGDFVPNGVHIQPDYSDRNDVLVFRSEPFAEAVTIAGSAEVRLEVSTSAPDTAFMVRLCEEFEDGRVVNLLLDGASSILLRNESDTVLDYTPGEKVVLTYRLWDTAWQIQKGSRLRLHVTSSNFPMYHIHPNRAGIWSTYEDWDKADQTVYTGSENSVVYLPILSKGN